MEYKKDEINDLGITNPDGYEPGNEFSYSIADNDLGKDSLEYSREGSEINNFQELGNLEEPKEEKQDNSSQDKNLNEEINKAAANTANASMAATTASASVAAVAGALVVGVVALPPIPVVEVNLAWASLNALAFTLETNIEETDLLFVTLSDGEQYLVYSSFASYVTFEELQPNHPYTLSVYQYVIEDNEMETIGRGYRRVDDEMPTNILYSAQYFTTSEEVKITAGLYLESYDHGQLIFGFYDEDESSKLYTIRVEGRNGQTLFIEDVSSPKDYQLNDLKWATGIYLSINGVVVDYIELYYQEEIIEIDYLYEEAYAFFNYDVPTSVNLPTSKGDDITILDFEYEIISETADSRTYSISYVGPDNEVHTFTATILISIAEPTYLYEEARIEWDDRFEEGVIVVPMSNGEEITITEGVEIEITVNVSPNSNEEGSQTAIATFMGLDGNIYTITQTDVIPPITFYYDQAYLDKYQLSNGRYITVVYVPVSYGSPRSFYNDVVLDIINVITPSTCEEEGEAEYLVTFTGADKESHSFTTTWSVPATGHNYSDVIYSWNEDYTVCVASRYCLNDESHVEEEVAEQYDRQVIYEPTEQAEGKMLVTAYFNNPDFASTWVEVIIPPLGQEITYYYEQAEFVEDAGQYYVSVPTSTGSYILIGEENYTKITSEQISPSCEADGYTIYLITFFGVDGNEYAIEYREDFEATGHNYGEVYYDWNYDEGTCTAYRTCMNDQLHMESETVFYDYVVVEEPTEYAYGIATAIATFNNPDFETQTTEIELPPTGGGGMAVDEYLYDQAIAIIENGEVVAILVPTLAGEEEYITEFSVQYSDAYIDENTGDMCKPFDVTFTGFDGEIYHISGIIALAY